MTKSGRRVRKYSLWVCNVCAEMSSYAVAACALCSLPDEQADYHGNCAGGYQRHNDRSNDWDENIYRHTHTSIFAIIFIKPL